MQHILFLKGLTDVPSLVEEMREPAVTAQFDNSVGHAQGKQLGGGTVYAVTSQTQGHSKRHFKACSA